MKKQTKQRVIMASAVVALAAVIIPQKAQALFGFGDIVFDPTSYASLGEIMSSNASMLTKAVELGTQTGKILTNAAATYAKIDNASHMVQAASRGNWAAIGDLIDLSAEVDNSSFAASHGWSQALNGNADVIHAFAKVTQGVMANPTFSSNISSHDGLAASLASADIADGAILNAMKALGKARLNQQKNDQSIRDVEDLADSAQDADNTQEASLNIIGAAAVQNLRMQQNQQALLASLGETTMPLTKIFRDTTVSDINGITTRQQSMAGTGAMPGGMGDSFKNY